MAVVLETLKGAINTKLVEAGCEVVSIYHRRLEHGYPTPSLGRDAVLAQALPWLQQHGIWSRGRFGSYKVRPCTRAWHQRREGEGAKFFVGWVGVVM
eukprot:366199-Chlamydomonas_euryale.AAC.13